MAEVMTHDSREALYREPMGAVPCGTRVTLRLRVDAALGDASATLKLWSTEGGGELGMQCVGSGGMWNTFEAAFDVPAEPCLVWYHFEVDAQGCTLFYGNAQDGLGGVGAAWTHVPPAYQITVYDGDFAPPRWMRDGIVYQILPDRFFDGCAGELLKRRGDIRVHEDWYEPPDKIEDWRRGDEISRDFFGGNLRGIEQKLDYLQSLNVSAIYLNPIFKAHSNHKYDTGDYLQIDPTFGDDADFRALCAAAREKGMRILLDGVFSHTGEDSAYFNRYGNYDSLGAYQSEESPYIDWYRFNEHPDDYLCWWGVPSLPEVDEMQPSFLDFIIRGEDAVIAKWLRLGAGGWRLDVADELPDEFIFMLRDRVRAEDADACVIGEVWEDATNKVAYGQPRKYALGRGLDSVMNYPLRSALIDFLLDRERAPHTRRRLLAQKENYPRPMYYALMNLLGSHDRVRILNVLAGCESPDISADEMGGFRLSQQQYDLGAARLRLMLAVIAALPGMPSVYYGDEAGVQGLRDPYCRFTYPWGREDRELLGAFRDILSRRRSLQVLRTGEVELFSPHPDVLCVLRTLRGGTDALGEAARDATAFVAVNRSPERRRAVIDLSPYQVAALFSADGVAFDCPGGVLSIDLEPLEQVLLIDRDAQRSLASGGIGEKG